MQRQIGGINLRRKDSSGYTLIEMIVVVTIVALLAALIMPNLVAIQRSRALRDIQAAVLRLPEDARNRARETRTPMQIRVEGDSLVLETDTEDQETQSTMVNNRLPSGDATSTNVTVNKRVSLGNEITVESARQNGDSVDPSAFRWVVFPDGSSTRGGLTFQIGNQRKSLLLRTKERAEWRDGDLPDETEERWSAGEVEQRVSS